MLLIRLNVVSESKGTAGITSLELNLSIYLSIRPSIYLNIYLSIDLYIYLSFVNLCHPDHLLPTLSLEVGGVNKSVSVI